MVKSIKQYKIFFAKNVGKDGFIDDESKTKYERCLRRTEFYKQIKEAGFEIIHEEIFAKDMLKDSDNYIYDSIKRRANELIDTLPDKREVIEEYLKSQEFENQMLENEIITGTWLLKYTVLTDNAMKSRVQG